MYELTLQKYVLQMRNLRCYIWLSRSCDDLTAEEDRLRIQARTCWIYVGITTGSPAS